MSSQAPLSTQFSRLYNQIPRQAIIFIQITLLLIIIVSVLSVYISLKNSRESTPFASVQNGAATLTLLPSSGMITPNSSKTLDLLVNTSNLKIDGVQAVVFITGQVPNDIRFVPNSIPGLTSVVNAVENTSSGKKISIAFLTSNPQQAFTTDSSSINIGQISFTSPSNGSMSIAFDAQLSSIIENQTSQDILKTPSTAQYTFSQDSGAQNPASLFFGQTTPQAPFASNTEFSVDVFANTANSAVSGVDAHVVFDPELLEAVSAQKAAASPFSAYPDLSIDNTTGRVYISANIGTSVQAQSINSVSAPVATIRFKTRSILQNSTLTFAYSPNNRNDSNIVLAISSTGEEPADILSQVGTLDILMTLPPTATPVALSTAQPTPLPQATLTPSLSSTPIPSPTLANAEPHTVIFSIQGKNRVEADKSIELRVELQPVDQQTSNSVTLTTDPQGTAVLSAIPDDYILLADAPGYLARKFGTRANPVRLLSNGSSLDLSSSPLLGGDFNNDNEINEIDYTLHFLNSLRQSNPVVDLDASGEVNTLDYSIMRSNWGNVSDTLE